MDASTLYPMLDIMQDEGLLRMADVDGYRIIVRPIATLQETLQRFQNYREHIDG